MKENFIKIFLKEKSKRKESMEEIARKIFLTTKEENLKKKNNNNIKI